MVLVHDRVYRMVDKDHAPIRDNTLLPKPLIPRVFVDQPLFKAEEEDGSQSGVLIILRLLDARIRFVGCGRHRRSGGGRGRDRSAIVSNAHAARCGAGALVRASAFVIQKPLRTQRVGPPISGRAYSTTG